MAIVRAVPEFVHGGGSKIVRPSPLRMWRGASPTPWITLIMYYIYPGGWVVLPTPLDKQDTLPPSGHKRLDIQFHVHENKLYILAITELIIHFDVCTGWCLLIMH